MWLLLQIFRDQRKLFQGRLCCSSLVALLLPWLVVYPETRWNGSLVAETRFFWTSGIVPGTVELE